MRGWRPASLPAMSSVQEFLWSLQTHQATTQLFWKHFFLVPCPIPFSAIPSPFPSFSQFLGFRFPFSFCILRFPSTFLPFRFRSFWPFPFPSPFCFACVVLAFFLFWFRLSSVRLIFPVASLRFPFNYFPFPSPTPFFILVSSLLFPFGIPISVFFCFPFRGFCFFFS